MEMLTDHGRCCFVVLLGYQPLTDGICDDVLDMVEGIAGKTVIKLIQEEKGGPCGSFPAINDRRVAMMLTWPWWSMEGSLLAGIPRIGHSLKKKFSFL